MIFFTLNLWQEQRFASFSWKWVYKDFEGRWLRIRQIFKIQKGESNMADENFEKSTIFMKINIQRFLKLLITNQLSDLWNSKWWIQYAGRKFWKIYNSCERVFELADNEFVITFMKFKSGFNIIDISFKKFTIIVKICIQRFLRLLT